MVLVRENIQNKQSITEGNQLTLDDIVGLSGFTGYYLTGKIYMENLNLHGGGGKFAIGTGIASYNDLSLIYNNRAVVSVPIKNIRYICREQKSLDFKICLNDKLYTLLGK